MESTARSISAVADERQGRSMVTRVAGSIGATVDGVDLAADLEPATIGEIRAALLEHRVLFFREQSLDHARHIRLGRCFGELTGRPRAQNGGDLEEFPEICTISPHIDVEQYGLDYEAHFRSRWASTISGWHTDMSHALNPPTASILRCETAPAYGGDTHWTNLVAAYAGLSEPVQQLIDGLVAEHTFWAGYRMFEHDPADRPLMEMVNAGAMVSVHPVVRVHPETGEKALFVNPSRTSRILGMTPVESRHLLDLLCEQVTRPEYTVRFRWEPGSVAFWDNRCTAHLAAVDVHPDAGSRIMHRVTVIGDIPVGPNGFRSYAVAGPSFGSPAR